MELIYREAAIGDWTGLPALLEFGWLRLGNRNNENFFAACIFLDTPAGPLDRLTHQLLAHIDQRREIIRCMAELAFRVQGRFEFLRQLRETDRCKQYTSGV
ncbi:hypothetical protein ES703_91549 [subsurface metagenome]